MPAALALETPATAQEPQALGLDLAAALALALEWDLAMVPGLAQALALALEPAQATHKQRALWMTSAMSTQARLSTKTATAQGLARDTTTVASRCVQYPLIELWLSCSQETARSHLGSLQVVVSITAALRSAPQAAL